MTRIAHLSDLHLVEEGHRARTALSWLRLSLISFGRPVDAEVRKARLLHALRLARQARADHVVLTGDLTEDGHPAQFQVLADTLRMSNWSPEEVTILPGNHDGYHHPRAFEHALGGSLSDWAVTSRPGAVTVLRNAAIMPLSTTIDQHFTRAAGALGVEQLEAIDSFAKDPALRRHALAIAIHHPPIPKAPGMQWIDGLQDVDALRSRLRAQTRLHVLAGHTHVNADHALSPSERARIFVNAAVVDHPQPVRFYEAHGGRLWAMDQVVPVKTAAKILAGALADVGLEG